MQSPFWHDPSEIPAGRLEESFLDHAPNYSEGEAKVESNRCLYCHDAPCIQACPTAIDIPRFIRRIATGNVLGAAREILTANLLGYSCGRVCPVEVLCVGACVYNQWDQPPIQIGRLQRFATEEVFSQGRTVLVPKPKRAIGKVALVGAGPASLACGGTLALAGIETVLYERDRWPGGLNTTGVAPYKMQSPDSLREVSFIRSLGVRIETGVEVGQDLTPEALLREFDAIFLGLGLGDDSRLGLPGEDGPGVVGATELIRRLKNDPAFHLDPPGRVLVVGGGNTAIDAARELRQLSRGQVSLVYRRTEAEMSAYAHELAQARKEGVGLIERAVPLAFVRDAGPPPEGRLLGLRIARSENGLPVAGTEQNLPANLVVIAVGQSGLARLASRFSGVEVDARGRITVDPSSGRTGNPKVWAGGDCANGGKEVVNAVAEGKHAARSILETLEALENRAAG